MRTALRRGLAAALLGAAPVAAIDLQLAQVHAPRDQVVHVGAVERVALEVSVRHGYHLQANPAAFPELIPLTLTLSSTQPDLEIGAPEYPRPRRWRLKGSETDLLVYDGRFRIVVPLRLIAPASTPILISGALSYQGCDDVRCLYPQSVQVEFELGCRIRGARQRSWSCAPTPLMEER